MILFPLALAAASFSSAATLKALPSMPAAPLAPAVAASPAMGWGSSARLFDGAGFQGPALEPLDVPRMGPALSARPPKGAVSGRFITRPTYLLRLFRTALMRHAQFFDIDGDGIISLSETITRLRQLGYGAVHARVIAYPIHMLLGPKTSGRMTLGITIANIHVGKHDSDTGVFDAQGNFVLENFERMFARFDKDRSGALNELEIKAMVAAHSKERPGGWLASRLEFKLLLDLAADGSEVVDGRRVRSISRARLRKFYDGTLLPELVENRRRLGLID